MATTISQAARDAEPETTMERESVASGVHTDCNELPAFRRVDGVCVCV